MASRRLLIIAAFLVLLCTLLGPGRGEAADHGSICIAYVPPKDAAHDAIYRSLREKRTLEKVRDHLTGLQFPRELTIRTEGCDGDVNAAYDPSDATIGICYE